MSQPSPGRQVRNFLFPHRSLDPLISPFPGAPFLPPPPSLPSFSSGYLPRWGYTASSPASPGQKVWVGSLQAPEPSCLSGVKRKRVLRTQVIPSMQFPGSKPAQLFCGCNYPHPATPLGTSAVCPSPSRAAPALSPERHLGTTFAPRRRWTVRRPPAGGSAVQCPDGRPRRQAQAGSPPPPAPRLHTRPNGSPCSPGDASPLGRLQSSTPCGQRTRGALRRGGWPGRARPRSSSTSAEKARDAGKAAGESRPSGPDGEGGTSGSLFRV